MEFCPEPLARIMVYFTWFGSGYVTALNTVDHTLGEQKKVNEKKGRQVHLTINYIKQAIESFTHNPLSKTS